MKTLLIFVVAMLIASFCNALAPVPTFTLNLDLPPQQRWDGAVKTIVETHGFEHSFGPVMDLYLPIGWIMPADVRADFKSIMQTRFPELYGELEGIWASLSKYATIAKLADFDSFLTVPFAYEVLHLNVLDARMRDEILKHNKDDHVYRRIVEFVENYAREQAVKQGITHVEGNKPGIFYKKACTAILALPSNKSQDIIQNRNMDEFPSPGRNLTLKITATKGGKPVWQALDWLWFSSGVETSSRAGGVTLELNYRRHFDSDRKANYSFSEMVTRLKMNSTIPVLLWHRVVHEKQLNFDQMIQFATQVATFAAPFYCISSGTGRRGAVLTLHFDRSRSYVAMINDTYVYPESEGLDYALVQTNYDILNGAPDAPGDPRRTEAQDVLRFLGRERATTELGTWMALSVYRVHNRDTMYTALMSVGKDIEGYTRRQMVPDPQIPLKSGVERDDL